MSTNNMNTRVAPGTTSTMTGTQMSTGGVKQEDPTNSFRNVAGTAKKDSKEGNYVTHDYHDYSNDMTGFVAADPIVHESMASSPTSGEQAFPVRLHYMLNEMEKDGLSHIVSWQPHGRCFLVHNKDLFVKEVLGSWFRMSKMPSFQRQLNLYGFKRLTTGPDKSGYYHELFLKHRPHLATRIQRFKIKGHGMRKAASPESEPNLYAFPPLTSSPERNVKAPVGFCSSTTNDRGSGSLSLQSMLPRALSHPSQVPSSMQSLRQVATPLDDCFASLGYYPTDSSNFSVGRMLPNPNNGAQSLALATALSAGGSHQGQAWALSFLRNSAVQGIHRPGLPHSSAQQQQPWW